MLSSSEIFCSGITSVDRARILGASAAIVYRTVPGCHAVRQCIFLDVETNFRFRWLRRGFEERPQLLIDFAQRGVMEEQGLINLGQPFQNRGIGGEIFAHFYEGTD